MDLQPLQDELFSAPTQAGWKKLGVQHHHGLVVPLFSIHTENSKGIGEFLDLCQVVDLLVQCGMDTLQLLPLNDTGDDTSPYNSVSAFALNPIHLSLHALPYLEEFEELQNQLQYLHLLTHTHTIDYQEIRKKKFRFLHEYVQQVRSRITISSPFLQFAQTQTWVESYALFKVLAQKFHTPNWEHWPEEFQTITSDKYRSWIKENAEEIEHFIILQFLCDQQMHQVKLYAEEYRCFIKGDIPILISRCSADVWANRHLFRLEFAAGAPPDMYSQDGQYWGFPLYNWEALARDDYYWWRQRVKLASRYYHLYRLDHVVGFFRIWAIPSGEKAIHGHFQPQDESLWISQGKKLLKLLIDAAPEMLPIGEDLGVIPNGVREAMRELGICGTKVIRWEKRWSSDQKFIPIHEYASQSMSTVSTHDSESLKEWILNGGEEIEQLKRLNSLGSTPSDSIQMVERFLNLAHHTNSLFHINLLTEYLSLYPSHLWGSDELIRINTPGVVSEKNWSYRIKPTIEILVKNSSFTHKIKELVTSQCHFILDN
jgi:4-alpha-glucanotransferase